VPQAKEVTLQTHGLDKYGRTLADVPLVDGTNVNHTLVQDGWCWWYRAYAPGDTVLEGLEKDAREAKQGLWVDPAPIPPWEWWKRPKRANELELQIQSTVPREVRSPSWSAVRLR
jgi:micrococcal nuclease